MWNKWKLGAQERKTLQVQSEYVTQKKALSAVCDWKPVSENPCSKSHTTSSQRTSGTGFRRLKVLVPIGFHATAVSQQITLFASLPIYDEHAF